MLGILLAIIIFILGVIIIWYCIPKWFPSRDKDKAKAKDKAQDKAQNSQEHFLNLPDSQLYQPIDRTVKPSDIQYQIPIAQNQLTDLQLQSLDTDVLRNARVLVNFSLTDELNFYQMYNLLKQFKGKKYNFKYNSSKDSNSNRDGDSKYHIMESERIMELNSGAINNTDLELFYRLKLELISAFNNMVIRNGYYLPYHQYQFFKIINSNLISNTQINSSSRNQGQVGNSFNYVMTMTIAREFKYQQFVLYWDIDLLNNENGTSTATINKIELIGIPIPKTIEFHENRKTEIDNEKSNMTSSNIYQLIKDSEKKEKERDEMLDIFRNQVSDSASYDVQPIGDGKMFQSPSTKFIDVNETSDMSLNLFDANSQNAFIENKIMNQARDKQFHNHRCYGLVNGVSQELVEYNDNPIFCKSYHPDIAQVGMWDAPCQVNTDCPFFQANKNYPNEFGKCNKQTGKCEMPLGVIPIGFTKYGKLEPQCYNCNADSKDNRCCQSQSTDSNMKSPDYIFLGDESVRREFADILDKNGLKVNPSI